MGKIADLFNKISGQSVYIDTNLFIYFLDRTQPYFSVAMQILEAVEAGDFIAYTGDITIAETLVKPYQTGDIFVIANIKAFFATDDFLFIVSHNAEIFDLAAQIRAKYRMKFPDALHYSTAIKMGCKFLITNDAGFRSSETLEIILLKDFIDN